MTNFYRKMPLMGLLVLLLASAGCSTQGGAVVDDRRATTTPGEPTIDGSLDDAVVRRVADEERGDLTNCYEMGLADDRALTGQVNIRFSIAPSGGVRTALLTNSTLKNDTVETCILEEIQLWVFPSFKDGDAVEVEYPFDFSKQ